jgi:hypothetical protein
MTDDSKKLILGLISGLSLEQVKPFFYPSKNPVIVARPA